MAKNMSSYTCNKNFHGTRKTIFEDFLGLTARLQNTKKQVFKKECSRFEMAKALGSAGPKKFPFQFLEEPIHRLKKNLYI
jgi:hypothetical protein